MNNSLVYGIHTVNNILTYQPERILKLLLLKDRDDERLKKIIDRAHQQSIGIDFVSKAKLDQMVSGQNHQGVIANVRELKKMNEGDLDKIILKSNIPLLLVLDGIQDPHNLGALLRVANGAGVDGVIAPKDKTVGITPTVEKVASGALATTPFIQVTNLVRTLRWLKEKNIWVYGLADEVEKNFYEASLTAGVALVLGSEGKGLRRLTQETCDDLFSIPMCGSVSSLNVASAASVCLYEALRQRRVSQLLG